MGHKWDRLGQGETLFYQLRALLFLLCMELVTSASDIPVSILVGASIRFVGMLLQNECSYRG